MASTIVKKSTGIYKSVVGVVAGSVMLDAPATVAINAAGVTIKAIYSSLCNGVGGVVVYVGNGCTIVARLCDGCCAEVLFLCCSEM